MKTIVLLAFSLASAAVDPDPRAREARELKEEISLLNLLNGLYPSDDQLTRLITLAKRADALEKEYASKMLEGADGHVSALRTLRDSLYSPTGSSPEVKGRAQSGQEALKSLQDKKADALGELEEQARGVLSEGQLAVVEDFKPCLIPPKNLRDPVAVGQASTTEKEEAALDLIRRMPPFLYKQRRDPIARMIVERSEREKGKMPDDVRTSMMGTLAKRLDEARALSDVDFGLKKAELAKEFQLFDDKTVYRQGHRRELGKVHKFLLSGEAAEIMARFRDAVRSAPAETELHELADSEPKDKERKQKANLTKRYGRAVMAMLQERKRSGKLKGSELKSLQSELQPMRESGFPEAKLAALDKAAERLNQLEVTEASLDAARARLGYLAAAKCLPPVLRPRGGKPSPVDVTGLGAMVVKANELEEQGRIAEAHRTLSQVADYLKAFKD